MSETPIADAIDEAAEDNAARYDALPNPYVDYHGEDQDDGSEPIELVEDDDSAAEETP